MTADYRLLCIEDDARLRRLMEEELTEGGYCVITAENAVTGILAFFNLAPALVLCDVRMPTISGFELLSKLARLDAHLFGVVFIFLTALGDRNHELEGWRLGADDFIVKPIDYDALRDVIRARLQCRHGFRRPVPLAPHVCELLKAFLSGSVMEPPSELATVLRHQFVST